MIGPRSLPGGYPRSAWGYSGQGWVPPHQEWGTPLARNGVPPGMIPGRRYASCIYAGGLSCLEIFFLEIKIKIHKIYTSFPIFFANATLLNFIRSKD